MINKYTVKLTTTGSRERIFNVSQDEYDYISLFLKNKTEEGKFMESDRPTPVDVYGQEGLM